MTASKLCLLAAMMTILAAPLQAKPTTEKATQAAEKADKKAANPRYEEAKRRWTQNKPAAQLVLAMSDVYDNAEAVTQAVYLANKGEPNELSQLLEMGMYEALNFAYSPDFIDPLDSRPYRACRELALQPASIILNITRAFKYGVENDEVDKDSRYVKEAQTAWDNFRRYKALCKAEIENEPKEADYAPDVIKPL